VVLRSCALHCPTSSTPFVGCGRPGAGRDQMHGVGNVRHPKLPLLNGNGGFRAGVCGLGVLERKTRSFVGGGWGGRERGGREREVKGKGKARGKGGGRENRWMLDDACLAHGDLGRTRAALGALSACASSSAGTWYSLRFRIQG
jgi:hypothetical protein